MDMSSGGISDTWRTVTATRHSGGDRRKNQVFRIPLKHLAPDDSPLPGTAFDASWLFSSAVIVWLVMITDRQTNSDKQKLRGHPPALLKPYMATSL